ncbi:MAG: Fis family transcriptional regulator [SAR86 cluster bacterium]|uniref:Fis family transcriptional regulator n=1 Tax=SAR86 cluster bacterium TaxID=2030880 RepID=A0A2A5BB37_9GAMM|nr:MAG: Fis family transcriptional regulator [SAR86 cluster bacterium]
MNDINDNIVMSIISSDSVLTLRSMLEGYDCPAILVSADYEILATNSHYQDAFGEIDFSRKNHCYQISHGYKVPCDQAGEDCPLGAASKSNHKERVLHIHQTSRGEEHVDVEMLPIHDKEGHLSFFVELLHPVPLASGAFSDQELVGKSASFQNMLSKVSRVGTTDASVLLLGESGTGKELAARAIHMSGKRKDKPLVTLECAGLTESLFESELFGHVKGAFTGAQANKKGLVELADGGTLFLDEIGDIPLPMQVKLLRLIETGTFRAVGSAELRRSDFRLICATHRNLFDMVEQGSFRNDLYYRINVFPITMPSLSERVSDIPQLAEVLLKRLEPEKPYHLTDAAKSLLQKIHYRGNIRELRNLLNRALVMADTDVLDEDTIEQCLTDTHGQLNKIEGLADGSISNTTTVVSKEKRIVQRTLKSNEQDYLTQLIASCGGDKSEAAVIAGISLRSLYRKLSPSR